MKTTNNKNEASKKKVTDKKLLFENSLNDHIKIGDLDDFIFAGEEVKHHSEK